MRGCTVGIQTASAAVMKCHALDEARRDSSGEGMCACGPHAVFATVRRDGSHRAVWAEVYGRRASLKALDEALQATRNGTEAN